ncbi:hypothetical protein [Borrelia sp. RT5S]|nr:hypothetical protein [Borrelia sp. RT5S]
MSSANALPKSLLPSMPEKVSISLLKEPTAASYALNPPAIASPMP